MDNQFDTAWDVLGIPRDSDRRTVTSAYRRLARATHPDLSSHPDADRFTAATWAYRLLSEASRSRRPLMPDPAVGPLPERSSPLGAGWSNRSAPEDLAEPRTTRVTDQLRVVRLFAGWAPAGVRSWDPPPIVAGPVIIRRSRIDDPHGGRDG